MYLPEARLPAVWQAFRPDNEKDPRSPLNCTVAGWLMLLPRQIMMLELAVAAPVSPANGWARLVAVEMVRTMETKRRGKNTFRQIEIDY